MLEKLDLSSSILAKQPLLVKHYGMISEINQTHYLFIKDNLGEVSQSDLGWGLILYGEEEEKVMEASTDPVISKIWRVSGRHELTEIFTFTIFR